MCSNILEPMLKPIELDIDVENRTGEVVVPGVFETKGEPVGNLVTCDIRRARIDLPNGFEHEIAEIDSSTTKATGKIELNLENSYVQFAGLRLSNRGIIDKAA